MKITVAESNPGDFSNGTVMKIAVAESNPGDSSSGAVRKLQLKIILTGLLKPLKFGFSHNILVRAGHQ